MSPRSLDLTSPDFFLRGCLKKRVFHNKPCTIDTLKKNITNKIGQIDITILRCTDSIQCRIQMCLAEHGGHFMT